jgi:capsid protein
MPEIQGFGNSSRRFGYDAAEPSNKRKRRAVQLLREDNHLPGRKRGVVTSTVRDQIRNFAVACWMVRKHLDYVASFTFQAKTDDEAVNDQVETFVASAAAAVDVSGRHPLSRLLRILEARAVVDGDCLVRRLNPANEFRRGKLQLIESELVNDSGADAPRSKSAEWVNGVLVGDALQPLGYSIHSRTGTGTKFASVIGSRDAFLHAYWESTHRYDQVRGTSAFASAANQLTDVGEGFNWALLKIKVAQMFGLKITREVDHGGEGYGQKKEGDEYNVDLSKGPFSLDMDPGDDAEFIESKTPASETVEFLQLIIFVAMKCLDLPISFFDESWTNFFGSRAALQHYLRSCDAKIEALQVFLEWWTRWRLGLAVFHGELILPGSMLFENLKWDWVPKGVPWWDPSKEITGNLKSVAAGLDNLQRICRSTGTDFYENCRLNAAALAYAASVGFPLNLETGTAAIAATGTNDEDDQTTEETDDGDDPADE